VKIWAYIILAGMIIGAVTTAYKVIDKNGYDRAVKEQQAAGIKAQNKAIEKRMKEWIDTQAAAKPVIIIEEKIVEKIRVVTKEVPRVVERIITIKPECNDLGVEYAGLLNSAVRASNQRGDPGASTADSMDAAL